MKWCKKYVNDLFLIQSVDFYFPWRILRLSPKKALFPHHFFINYFIIFFISPKIFFSFPIFPCNFKHELKRRKKWFKGTLCSDIKPNIVIAFHGCSSQSSSRNWNILICKQLWRSLRDLVSLVFSSILVL